MWIVRLEALLLYPVLKFKKGKVVVIFLKFTLDRRSLHNRWLVAEMNEDKWIGIDEAADYLGVNKDSIRNWIKKDSEIPAHKIGKQWKFKRSELDEWVKSGKSAIE